MVGGWVVAVVIYALLVVKPKPHAVVGTDIEVIAATHGGFYLAFPARRYVAARHAGSRNGLAFVARKINGGLGERGNVTALLVLAVEIVSR